MEAAEGDLGGRAIEMAKQEASYKPTANGQRQGGFLGGLFGSDPEDMEASDTDHYRPTEEQQNLLSQVQYLKGIGYTDTDEILDLIGNMSEENKAFLIERLNAKADGGIIGLANGGEPTHEMDYRGGGFIPVGAYERADDVPARLSKNEFVMTADAVRAAGGGSIEKGSQRMYDLMNGLEAQA